MCRIITHAHLLTYCAYVMPYEEEMWGMYGWDNNLLNGNYFGNCRIVDQLVTLGNHWLCENLLKAKLIKYAMPLLLGSSCCTRYNEDVVTFGGRTGSFLV